MKYGSMDCLETAITATKNKKYYSQYPNCKAINISSLKYSKVTVCLNLETFHFLTLCLSFLFISLLKHRQLPALYVLIWFLSNSNVKMQNLTKTDHTHTMSLTGEVSDFSKVEPADLEDAHQMAPTVCENDTAFLHFHPGKKTFAFEHIKTHTELITQLYKFTYILSILLLSVLMINQ